MKRIPANGPTLPFSRRELNDDTAVVVHFKIATDDLELRLALSQQISAALKGVRVNGHSIVPIITDENVTMSSIDARAIAAHITPYVLQAAGLPSPLR